MDDVQRLVVSLEARLDKYEKDMARAGKATNDNYRRMERRTKQFADNTEQMTGKAAQSLAKTFEKMFAPFLRGGAVFAGVAGAAVAVKEIADSIAEVDREARKAGVSAKTWQQWQYVATATGASVDGVTDALKELNIRANEFALTGKGSGAEWFARLGYTAEEVGRKLQDPNRFLDEIIAKLQRLDSGSQTRALDELFGGTGAEQLAKVLGLSVQQIQKLRSEAATYSNEEIEAARKIDSEWDKLWHNVTIYAKKAAIEGVSYAQQIAEAIRGLNPNYGKADPYAGVPKPESLDLVMARDRLAGLKKSRDNILKQIGDTEAGPDWFGKSTEISELKGTLSALEDQISDTEEQIIDLGGGSDQLKQALKELSAMTQRAGGAFDGTASQASSFKSALEDLKKLVPGLKAELDELGKLDAIDAAFRKAVGSAQTMGEVLRAVDIANRAKTITRFGAHDNILDLIGAAEGTDKGRGYNETLGYGAFTGGAVNLTGMTLNEVLALQKRMLADPNNTYNSSAVGRYQIVRSTLQDAMKDLGLTGDRLFNEDTQDEVARYLLRRRGNDPTGLRNEWEGLRNVDDATIRQTYSNTPVGAQKLAPTEGQQRQTDLLKQQTEARKRLNDTIEQGLDRARFEQSLTGVSADQRRIELELYDRIAEAKRSGVTLTDDEIRKMRDKITLTDQLNVKNREAVQSEDALHQAGHAFAQTFTSSLSGLLTGTMSVNDAVRNLTNSLIDAALQAALLGQGPLASLFGTAASGGLFGLLGFADGGYTGQGGKYQPAGVVHRGEYVMSKRATERLGVGNLDILHRSALRGYADGGHVGERAVATVSRTLHGSNDNAPAPAVQINAPITVNGSAGTPEQNQDLAKRMAKQVEGTVRGVVADEMRKQMRPGNMLRSKAI
jgi:phage-related minor tail protein